MDFSLMKTEILNNFNITLSTCTQGHLLVPLVMFGILGCCRMRRRPLLQACKLGGRNCSQALKLLHARHGRQALLQAASNVKQGTEHYV